MKFIWTTINVKDLEQSLAFYTEVIGLEVNRRFTPMEGNEIAFLGKEETQVELIANTKNPDPVYGRDISLGFEVESLEETMAMLEAKGIAIAAGPFQPAPYIRFLYVVDPNGLRVQLVENIAP